MSDGEKLYRVTVTSSRRAVRTLVEMEQSISQLTQHFSTFEVGEKDGEAVIPGLFRPCWIPCRNEGKPKSFNCGGGASHRLGSNVDSMTMLGADLDHLEESVLMKLLQGLKDRGLRFWVWNTHSHAPSHDCRARVLIPFREPLPLPSHKAWSQVAWPALIRFVGLDGAAGADHACRDPARVYYLPRKPDAAAEREAGFCDGAELDWRAVLGDSLEKMAAVQLPAIAAPVEDPSRPVDLNDVRERLRRVEGNQGTRALVRAILAGNAPTPPPAERQPGMPSRYVAWRTVTGALAAVAHDWEATGALLQILTDSYSAEVEASPSDHTEWDVIEGLFESARAGMPAYRAEREAARKAEIETFRRMLALQHHREPAPAEKPQDPETDEEPAPVAAPAATVDPSAWAQECILDPPTKDGPPKIKNCAANVSVILQKHPSWAGVLRFNELTKGVEMWGGPLMHADEQSATHGRGPLSDGKRVVRDSDAVHVAAWLAREFGIHQSDGVVWARIVAAAESNSYDPLADYLNGIRWDGKSRIDQLLTRYFGAKLDENAEYLRLAGRRWLISGAARGLNPGCQADCALIIEGGQGSFKTTAARILGGPFFSSEAIDFGAKDSMAVVSQAWIFEMGELESFRKSAVTQQKQFLSKTWDDFRPPYGRVTARHLRRCIFIGTTNTDDYLQDETGNRRYWPVDAGTVDTNALAQDRDQLWAEAVAMYRAAENCSECPKARGKRCAEHRWWFELDEAFAVKRETEKRAAPDSIAEAIEHWITERAQDRRPTQITTGEIIREILQETPGRGQEIKIGKALRLLGFKRVRRMVAGRQSYYFETPLTLLEATKVQGPTVAQRIAQARGMQVIAGSGSGLPPPSASGNSFEPIRFESATSTGDPKP